MFCFVFSVILFGLAGSSQAQNWSGIIDRSRATDWSGAGATITHRTTQCGPTIAAYSGSANTISTAIANCPAGQFVQLGAGTFTLSSGIVFQTSNVTLRGAGAGQTKLIVNSGVSGCGLGSPSAIRFCGGGTGTFDGGAKGGANMSHQNVTATFATYTQGTNTVTLSTVAGLVAGPVGTGSIIMLDQTDDASDGYPAAGDLDVCGGGPPCSNQGGNNWGQPGSSQVEVKTVTAINGSTITFTPGLQAPNWRSSRTQSAYWNNSQLRNAGIEDLTVDTSNCGCTTIQIKDVSNSWITGIRSISKYSGSGAFDHFSILMASNLTIRSNYLYGPASFGLGRYSLNDSLVSSNVFENNILHEVPSGILPNDPGTGNVYAYNYLHNTGINCNPQCSPSFQFHSGTIFMDLIEGNNLGNIYGDIIHGVHYMNTFFRNHVDGYAHMVTTPEDAGIELNYHNRFYNVIGNVIGHSHFTTYQTDQSSNDNAIFETGHRGSSSPALSSDDPHVLRTLMRWGNWDSVTSTNDNGTNDSTGTRFVSAEVPSGITSFANAVPGSQALPASFYLSAQPSWWGTPYGVPAWPPIGPDVANSNITTATGGHANKIPARLCFENTASDPAYSTLPTKIFSASTCYLDAGGAPPPPPPTSPAAPSGLIVSIR
jgi:hypothetical protein